MIIQEKLTRKTYFEYGVGKLEALCHAAGITAKTPQILEMFHSLTSPWSNQTIQNYPLWLSDVTDDHTPFEFSVAFEGNQPELRILFEAQGNSPNLESYWQAGLQINQLLVDVFKVNLERFYAIEDIFYPKNLEAKFVLWHSVCLWAEREPKFKLYLNPQIQGKSQAAAVIKETLIRLGFASAWSTLAEISSQRGLGKDEFCYFSLDLSHGQDARVKIYLRHYDATPEYLEKVLSIARNYVPGDATEFCQAMAEGVHLFSAKPIISTFAFVTGDDVTPSSGTLHLPIAHYAPNDAIVRDRLHNYFTKHNLPLSSYNSIIEAFATRPLEEGIGIHQYTSLRRENQEQRITLYLAVEAHKVNHPQDTVETKIMKTPSPLEEIVWHYEHNSVTNHPFLQRLQEEQVNPTHLWILLANAQKGIVEDFARRLASVIARIDDERIRCILTKQLNDELGDGDFSRTHRKLFNKLMTAIATWQPTIITEATFAPGKELSQYMEEVYSDPNPYIGVGAAIIMEIRGKQFDICVGKEFRRTKVELSSCEWLTMHEELELDHAEESLTLARLIPDSNEMIEAVRRGADRTNTALTNFLNSVYQLCLIS